MSQSFRRLLGYLGSFVGLLAAVLLLMTVAAVLDAFTLVLLIPFLQSLFGMEVLGSGASIVERLLDGWFGAWLRSGSPLDSLRNVCLLVLGALVLKNVFLYGSTVLSLVVQEGIERRLREDVYGHVQYLPLSFFDRAKVGQLITRVLSDTHQARSAVSDALVDVLRQSVTAVTYTATLVFLSWRLTLVALVTGPLIAIFLGPIVRRLKHSYGRAFEQRGELFSVAQETMSGIRLVKSFGAEEVERDRFRNTSHDYTRRMIRAGALSTAAGPLSETLSSFIALVLIWIGANMVLSTGALSAELFVAFVTIAVRLVSPIKALAQFPARVQTSLAAADRFFEILDVETERMDGDGPPAKPPTRSLRFESVDFEYEPGRPVLRDISFEARPGEVVALAGPSGAGKTTLVDLLPRFIDPTRGRITIDGVDVREFQLRSLRSLFGVVSQDTVIFNDTVRANVSYGRRRPEPEILAAIRAANAEEFVLDLPQGLDTPLGDRGLRLSGGQRQRIGIARAILNDPPLLILDEATSSLDTETERLIQAALERLLRGRTVFVIAHRLSTIRGADQILVLDEGRVVESGSHDVLYTAAGAYRKLCDLQFSPAANADG